MARVFSSLSGGRRAGLEPATVQNCMSRPGSSNGALGQNGPTWPGACQRSFGPERELNEANLFGTRPYIYIYIYIYNNIYIYIYIYIYSVWE